MPVRRARLRNGPDKCGQDARGGDERVGDVDDGEVGVGEDGDEDEVDCGEHGVGGMTIGAAVDEEGIMGRAMGNGRRGFDDKGRCGMKRR